MHHEYFSFRFAEHIIGSKSDLKEQILEIVKETSPGAPRKGQKREFKFDQKQLNNELVDSFTKGGWTRQPAVVKGMALKTDFRKDRVQLEIQFGNAARFYADLLKFQIAFVKGDLDAGVEIVAEHRFAKSMGENLAYYERCSREIEQFKPIITIPIWLIGIEPDEEDSPFSVTSKFKETAKSGGIEWYEQDI